MATFRTWWRTLGGLMVVALAAAFIAGPALDALVCLGDDKPAVAVASVETTVLVVEDLASNTDQGHVGPDACAHGHCHHLAGLGLALSEDADATRPADAHSWAIATTYAAFDPSSLDRPPRA